MLKFGLNDNRISIKHSRAVVSRRCSG